MQIHLGHTIHTAGCFLFVTFMDILLLSEKATSLTGGLFVWIETHPRSIKYKSILLFTNIGYDKGKRLIERSGIEMWLMQIIGGLFVGAFAFLGFGMWCVYMDYKQESEMGERLGDTLNGKPPERSEVKVRRGDWLVGLEKLGVYIDGVEGYEMELRRDLRELINITLPEMAGMSVGVDMKVKYGGAVRREILAVIAKADEERAAKARDEVEFLVEYGLGEKAKN